MADQKITDLTTDSSPTDDDLLVTVNDPAGTPANRKVTVADLSAKVASDVASAGTALTDISPASGAMDADDTVYGEEDTNPRKFTKAQILGTDLNAIAALVAAADRLPYYTGSGTAALATFTTFARTLLDDTSAADMAATGRYGIIATDTGATCTATTTPTSLLAATFNKPAATANDMYRARFTATVVNLSGGALTDTITATYAGNNLWTPFTISIGNAQGATFIIDMLIRVATVGTSVTETIFTRFESTDPASAQQPLATATRLVTITPTVNNTGNLAIAITSTHSSNSVSFTTIGNGGFLERIPRAT